MSGLSPAEQAAFDRWLAAEEAEPDAVDAWLDAEAAGRLSADADEEELVAYMTAHLPDDVLRREQARKACHAFARLNGWPVSGPYRPGDATLAQQDVTAWRSARGMGSEPGQ